MDKLSLSEILNNKHFNQIAAVLAIAQAPSWRTRHPEVPSVRAELEQLHRLLGGTGFPDTIKTEFTAKLTAMLVRVVSADQALSYNEDDFNWLVSVLDSEPHVAKMTLSMLFLASMTRQVWYTAEQVSEMTGEAAGTWRNRAASGSVIGAYKAGKTWLFPAMALRAYGVNVELPLKVEVE